MERMSMPPESGWQPPQQSGSPPNQGQPYGQQFNPSGYNPQQPPPPGWQQGSWPQQPGQPPQKGSSLKWLLIAVAVLLVIGISIGATLIFTRTGGGRGQTTPSSGAPSDIASANDTGPVSIITNEPTCQAYMTINNTIADVEANGWGSYRSTLGPDSEWTPDQRSQVQAVAVAMGNAADQVVPLAKQTPHRVVRELYEQFVAYGRAYVASVANYIPRDNGLASANVNAGSTLAGICNAITYGSASRSLTLEPAPAPTQVASPDDSGNPKQFVTSSNPTCQEWIDREGQFTAATGDWANLDTGIAGSEWTPEQRALQQSAVNLLSDWSRDMKSMAKDSQGPVFEDFALLASLYIDAYVPLGDKYTESDAWLTYTAFRLSNIISGACRAAG
jgi:hypothetical protein